MRVFGELSFYISIICLASFAAKDTAATEPNVNVVSTSQTNEAETDDIEGAESDAECDVECDEESDEECEQSQPNDIDEDIQEKSVDFFHSFLFPPRLRITTINFMQKVDHFNRTDYTMWTQRAYLDTHYEQNDGPVILKVGGLKEICKEELQDPYMVEMAKFLHAPMYVLELRYQGRSVPTSLETENLERLCRSEQALADIERFMGFVAHSYKKWIVYGEGYGGTLATWFRLKYPHSLYGAMAFNAPVVAVPENVDFYKDFQIALKYYLKAEVLAILQEGFEKLEQITDYHYLQVALNMCTRLDEGNLQDNKKFMFWSILMYLKEIIERSEYRDSIMTTLMTSTLPPLNRLFLTVNLLVVYSGEFCLFVDYAEAIKKYKNIRIKYDNEIDYPKPLKYGLGPRAHHFLRCTEFGLFETSDGTDSFGIELGLDFFARMCKQIFDRDIDSESLKEAMDNTNLLYGGKDIDITKLIYMTKTDAVWQHIGLTEAKGKDVTVIDFSEHTICQMKSEYESILGQLFEWTRNKYRDYFVNIGLADHLEDPAIISTNVGDKSNIHDDDLVDTPKGSTSTVSEEDDESNSQEEDESADHHHSNSQEGDSKNNSQHIAVADDPHTEDLDIHHSEHTDDEDD